MLKSVFWYISLLQIPFRSHCGEILSDVVDTYLTFISNDLERHRNFIQNYYDQIFITLSIVVSAIGLFFLFLNWRTYRDAKDSAKKYWEKHFNKIFDEKVKEYHDKLDYLNQRIDDENERLNQSSKGISLLNKMIFDRGDKDSKHGDEVAKILWVDDNPNNNSALIDLLKDNKIESIIETNTKDAIDYLRQNGYRNISVLITDMKRDSIVDEGIKLIKEIKSRFGNIPTIVYTSSKTPNNLKMEAQQLGAKLTTNPSKLLNYVYSILLKDSHNQ